MEFWGVEVKPGNALKVKPEEDYFIHLSQAALGETKKGKASESVPLFVKVGDQKIVMGTLSHEKFPQLSFDLIFEKEFELSHNWKNGSVYVFGYKTPFPEEEEEDLFDGPDSSSDEEELLAPANSGKPLPGVERSNPAKANTAIPEKSDSSDDSDDDESEKDSMDEDSDLDSEDEAEEKKKKVDLGKKRANDSAIKTPVSSKKAKSATPQKTDGKKGGHTATPHPAKQAGKTPASSSQSPKSGGQFSCKSCTKTFGSDVGLQSHKKAKHGGK